MIIIQSLTATPLAVWLLLSKSHSESTQVPRLPLVALLLQHSKPNVSSKPHVKHQWVHFLLHFRITAMSVRILLHSQTGESHPWRWGPNLKSWLSANCATFCEHSTRHISSRKTLNRCHGRKTEDTQRILEVRVSGRESALLDSVGPFTLSLRDRTLFCRFLAKRALLIFHNAASLRLATLVLTAVMALQKELKTLFFSLAGHVTQLFWSNPSEYSSRIRRHLSFMHDSSTTL